jgi:lipoate-protein ligase B
MRPDLAGDVRVLDWGLRGYERALTDQLALHGQRVAQKIPDTLVTVEHPATITLGRQASEDDVVWGPDERARRGIELTNTDRGGRATYHGPGQLVIYPIVAVAARRLGAKDWVHLIEESLLELLASFGVTGSRKCGSPGIWTSGGKIASLGLRLSRGVSYHGLSLNTSLDPKVFGGIVTCGVASERVTTLSLETEQSFDEQEVRTRACNLLIAKLEEHPART